MHSVMSVHRDGNSVLTEVLAMCTLSCLSIEMLTVMLAD